MRGEVTFDFIRGISMRIEVNHCDVAKPVSFGDSRGAGPGNRVISAKNDGHNPPSGDRAHSVVDGFLGLFPHSMADDGIAKIHHPEMVKDFDTQVEVIRPRVIRIGPQRSGTKPGTGAIGGSRVPGSTDDRDIWLVGVELGGF